MPNGLLWVIHADIKWTKLIVCAAHEHQIQFTDLPGQYKCNRCDAGRAMADAMGAKWLNKWYCYLMIVSHLYGMCEKIFFIYAGACVSSELVVTADAGARKPGEKRLSNMAEYRSYSKNNFDFNRRQYNLNGMSNGTDNKPCHCYRLTKGKTAGQSEKAQYWDLLSHITGMCLRLQHKSSITPSDIDAVGWPLTLCEMKYNTRSVCVPHDKCKMSCN